MNQPWLLTGALDDLAPTDRWLVLSTLDALVRAECAEVVGHLSRGLLAAVPDGPAGDAADARLLAADGSLQPFAELMFRELGAIVTQTPGWTADMRFVRALEVITLAGF